MPKWQHWEGSMGEVYFQKFPFCGNFHSGYRLLRLSWKIISLTKSWWFSLSNAFTSSYFLESLTKDGIHNICTLAAVLFSLFTEQISDIYTTGISICSLSSVLIFLVSWQIITLFRGVTWLSDGNELSVQVWPTVVRKLCHRDFQIQGCSSSVSELHWNKTRK